MSEIQGANAEVLADCETGKVVARFLHPVTGAMVVEVHVSPDVAREFAFNLTRASLAVEDAATH